MGQVLEEGHQKSEVLISSLWEIFRERQFMKHHHCAPHTDYAFRSSIQVLASAFPKTKLGQEILQKPLPYVLVRNDTTP